jgi:hypothetical protein
MSDGQRRARIRGMKLHGIRAAVVVSLAVAAGGETMRAQTQGTTGGVQVAVPQGSAQDRAAAATQQQRQQDARSRLANEPPPRTADGHNMCQQANQAYTLIVGEGTSVDRTTLIVP